MNTLNLFTSGEKASTGIELINISSLLELTGRFALNLMVILILVRWFYFSTTRRKDFLFTYILISSIVFLLCFLLENVMLQIGFALGLFAIFGIIRYRTHAIPIKEMTYLFLIIGISVINALASTASISEIVFTNLALIVITYGLEKKWLLKHESSKSIIYEKINLILPEHHQELLEDLQRRTGISKISRIEIGEVDFLKDVCRIIIFFETSDRMDSNSGLVRHKKDIDED
jgi:Domain of unknown function (DUF4956)